MRLIPVLLSALLLAAHFLRAGDLPLVLMSLLFPAVLLVRRPWAGGLVQGLLVLGGLEWVRTLWTNLQLRQAAGEPWLRMSAILATVALLTIASAWLVPRRGPRQGAP